MKLYLEFKSLLRRHSKSSYEVIDYYSLLIEFYTTFREIENPFSDLYSHVFVDETQDICELQFKCCTLIAKGKTSFWVGDPYQSIFSHLSKCIDFKTELLKHCHGNVKFFELKINHRVKNKKLSYSLDCIRNRKLKHELINIESTGDNCIFYINIKDFETQLEAVKKIVKEKRLEQKTVFVASRTNSSVKVLSKYLLGKGVDHELWSDNNHKRSDVILSSIGRLKGCETDCVIIINFVLLEFPFVYSRNPPKKNIEQRNLHKKSEFCYFYVGCSRAKQEIYLIHPTVMAKSPTFFEKDSIIPGVSPYYTKYVKHLSTVIGFSGKVHPLIEECKNVGKVNDILDSLMKKE